MPRQPRRAQGGVVFHAINRGNGRMRLFEKEQDYLAWTSKAKGSGPAAGWSWPVGAV